MKKAVKFILVLAVLLVASVFVAPTSAYADSDTVRVELVPPSHWHGVGAWGWGDNCDVMQGAGWPGSALPFDEATGAYVFEVDRACLPFTMFFMDTVDAYDRVPAHGTGYLHIEDDMRIVMGGLRVELVPPATWAGVGFWGWGAANDCDVTGGADWPGEALPWDETAQAYVLTVDESCAPFTMFFMDTANAYARFPAHNTGYLEIEGSARFDQSGLRVGFTHPNWSQVYLVAWDANGYLEGFEDGAAMSFDAETGEWEIAVSVEGVEMPFTVFFHNGAGERTANRPITRPDTIPYSRVQYVVEVDEPAVEDTPPVVEEVVEPVVVEEDNDNTVMFIVIGAVVVVVIIGAVVASKKKK